MRFISCDLHSCGPVAHFEALSRVFSPDLHRRVQFIGHQKDLEPQILAERRADTSHMPPTVLHNAAGVSRAGSVVSF